MQRLGVVSWNILAPIWVHPAHYPGMSLLVPLLQIGVDTSILETSSRTNLRLRTLKQSTADIFLLQEVQTSEFDILTEHMGSDFEVLGLCKNDPQLWQDWLKGNKHQDNGIVWQLRN
jgi:hypothetical protein